MCALFAPHLQSKHEHRLWTGKCPTGSQPRLQCHESVCALLQQSLRVQFDKTSVTVVEISPPLVGTDLTRDQPDPSFNKVANNKMAISQDQFMKVGAGFALDSQSPWQDTFGGRWRMLNGLKQSFHWT